MNIYRFEETHAIGTDLDPIEDILNFITTLKSRGFTEDILRQVHGFSDSKEITRVTKSIRMHVENAVSLANQGFEGPPETSFLSIYYSILNLIKVELLFLGKRIELENNRWHGATYNDTEMSRDFLNERIHINNRGTIPLIYATKSGKIIGRNGMDVRLDEIYSKITSIGAEYITITKIKNKMLPLIAKIIQDDGAGHYLKIQILDEERSMTPPKPRTLKAFKGLKIIRDPSGEHHYESNKIQGRFDRVKRRLIQQVQRHLLSDCLLRGQPEEGWYSYTPINGRFHVFSEELCIMLAYFHLSNVVRYNPEHLHKLMDSKYWAMILGLKKHGYLKYLKLMWSNVEKKSFDII